MAGLKFSALPCYSQHAVLASLLNAFFIIICNCLCQAVMKFPLDYPYSPPSVRFLCKMWHPNVYEVCNSNSAIVCSLLEYGIYGIATMLAS